MILFHAHSTFILSGSTGSRKTSWLHRLIQHKDEMFESPPSKILYFYGIWQPLFEVMEKEGVEFYQGLPTEEMIGNGEQHTMIILDDLQQEVVNSELIEKLFTQGSHHRNVTVVYLTQNLFRQGKNAHNITLNGHYMVFLEILGMWDKWPHLENNWVKVIF